MTLNELFFKIKSNVHAIVQTDMNDCNWYIGVSNDSCQPYTDSLKLLVRFKNFKVGATLADDDLTTGQDQLISNITTYFRENYETDTAD